MSENVEYKRSTLCSQCDSMRCLILTFAKKQSDRKYL